MANWPFTQGVHDIGNGLYGYVQPDGTWGWSNAGLVGSRGETLLVDRLMSAPLTRAMLNDFAKVPGGGTGPIGHALDAFSKRRSARCRYMVEKSLEICMGQLGKVPLVDNVAAGTEMSALLAEPI